MMIVGGSRPRLPEESLERLELHDVQDDEHDGSGADKEWDHADDVAS